MSKFGPLVSPEWLHKHRSEPDLRIVDFRWYLLGRQGRDAYLAGHIPSAVFVDLDAVTGKGPGRHPLPTRQQFQDEMRRAGVSASSRVVVYDDAGGSIAARLWFLLGWFGHGQQAVLDSGLQGWGQPLETAVPFVRPGDFKARAPKRSRIMDFDQVKRLSEAINRRARAGSRVLIDARVRERYRGEKEPIDPKKGHIPGAVSAPWIDNLDAEARFKSPEELRRRFEGLGVDGTNGAVVYCGSGVNACHDLLALEVAGITDVRLYEGSWSDWSHRDAPVATGDKA
jgi:thiosulfate/3-mercaptopyruvate sulfurtransferase